MLINSVNRAQTMKSAAFGYACEHKTLAKAGTDAAIQAYLSKEQPVCIVNSPSCSSSPSPLYRVMTGRDARQVLENVKGGHISPERVRVLTVPTKE
jgi:hypothetical protein